MVDWTEDERCNSYIWAAEPSMDHYSTVL